MILLLQVLQQVASHVTLRADQLEEILFALKDSSLDIRESLHTFLGTTLLSTIACVKLCVTGLLDNLRRYPQVSFYSKNLQSVYHFIHNARSLLSAVK